MSKPFYIYGCEHKNKLKFDRPWVTWRVPVEGAVWQGLEIEWVVQVLMWGVVEIVEQNMEGGGFNDLRILKPENMIKGRL